MGYQALLAYDRDGGFAGYVIQKQGTTKLYGSNIYAEGEEVQLREQVNRLNESELLQQFWPSANDPDVIALLNDPTFEPSTETETITVPVLDEEHSRIVMDANGVPDEEASNLVYYNATITQPVNNIERGHKALETVARRRMANAQN